MPSLHYLVCLLLMQPPLLLWKQLRNLKQQILVHLEKWWHWNGNQWNYAEHEPSLPIVIHKHYIKFHHLPNDAKVGFGNFTIGTFGFLGYEMIWKVIYNYFFKVIFIEFEQNVQISLKKKKDTLGISLLVQWLRLHSPNAGAQVRFLLRELDPTCYNSDLAQPKKQINIFLKSYFALGLVTL